MPDEQKKTYLNGLDTEFDLNTAPESYLGGNVLVPAGVYQGYIYGVSVKPALAHKKHRNVEFQLEKGPDEEVMHKGKVVDVAYFLAGDNNPQGWWRGFFEASAPWALWQQFLITTPQGTGHMPLDWLTGGENGVGALMQFELTQVETARKEEPTKKFKVNDFVKGSVKLIQPSSYAMRILQQAGVDWTLLEAPATLGPQQALMETQLRASLTAKTQNGQNAGATPAQAPAATPAGMAGIPTPVA